MSKTSRKTMSLNGHLKIADDLAIAFVHLHQAFRRIADNFPASSRLVRTFLKILPGLQHRAWIDLKNELEKAYCQDASDQEFKELGHIHYGLKDRYIDLLNKGLISTELYDESKDEGRYR